ncbi:hypothetical protein PUN28_016051 [Cardiocondyla obscurior]|uniref:Uncharacterized protein n=1 Tax=Cardiocondyla obscurior TaxID=286306 RepID=A0AAW2EVK9_9HYME
MIIEKEPNNPPYNLSEKRHDSKSAHRVSTCRIKISEPKGHAGRGRSLAPQNARLGSRETFRDELHVARDGHSVTLATAIFSRRGRIPQRHVVVRKWRSRSRPDRVIRGRLFGILISVYHHSRVELPSKRYDAKPCVVKGKKYY